MVVKALYYFLAFFFIVIIILLTQEPYILDLDKEDIGEPIVEFTDVKDFKIDESGINMLISADNARRFKDKDILYNINAYMQKNGVLETLKSDNATLISNIVYLDGDVVYTRNETLTLKTNSVEYHQNDKTIIGKNPFELSEAKFTAIGDSFIYDTKDGKIDAENIKANIEMGQK